MRLTAPVLVPSILQPGMIFESATIQLLILSRRRLSTAHQQQERSEAKSRTYCPKSQYMFIPPSLYCPLQVDSHQRLRLDYDN